MTASNDQPAPKKASSRRRASKKAPAKKATAKKATAKESASGTSGGSGRVTLASVVPAAVGQFASLTGRIPESVAGARQLDDGDGWSVLVEAVELERIPQSTSVIATYRVDLEPDGTLKSYERIRRYSRGATDAR